ncbi:MAG: MFS transporter [Clostridiales bacterium]|nr:MFS transporter [Clostridiales bacterium]
MKLNYRNTVLVGLAFLAITAFWQMYDNVIPLILTNTFSLNETWTGAIMAADNVLALILLPVFGKLSDRTRTRIGKRMPYILIGTLVAIVLINILPVIDDKVAAGVNTAFYGLAGFIIILGLLLFTMSVFRSPAVALMPDITPKPLRSKGNAVINLMGAAGGIIYLAFTAIMYPKSKTEGLDHVSYRILFVFISAVMALAVIIMLLTVKENALSSENDRIEKEHPEWDLSENKDSSSGTKLPKDVFRSMLFLLASIMLWYIGYNAVVTWFTPYIKSLMGEDIGGASTCFLIANVGAIISYIPLGQLAGKIGRKKSIFLGTLILTLTFGLSFFLTTMMHSLNVLMFIVFALVGFAWAAININSLPMVVEMCKGSDTGKFTGFYYTASMAGQILTPILSGFLMRHVSYKILFIYAAAFAFLSFLTMTRVHHGDIKVAGKTGLEAFEDLE